MLTTRCITNCHQGFWGMMKPQNAIALSSISDADESFNTVMAQLKTTTENETNFLIYRFGLLQNLPYPNRY